MEYTTRVGDRPDEAHVNYQCPCGCVAGLIYDHQDGAQHLGQCCCGRILWVGSDAETVVRGQYKDGVAYELEFGLVSLPWGEEKETALAVPREALAKEQAKRDAGKIPTKVVDPVCRMMFDPDEAAATTIYQGTTFYFCATSCKAKFDANPKQYVASRSLLDRIRGR